MRCLFSRSLIAATFFLFLLVASPPITARGFDKKDYTTKYDPYFRKYSKRYFGVPMDWKWFKAQAIAESNLNHEAESWVKAKGIMQIMPRTYQSLQDKLPELGEITDARWNIAAGIYYDKKMWNYWKAERPFNDRLAFMFASYNAGPSTIIRAQKVCSQRGLDENRWDSVREIASEVNRWRAGQTLHYVNKIFRLKEEALR